MRKIKVAKRKESDKTLCEQCIKSIEADEYDRNSGLCDECKAKSFGKRVRSMI